MAGDKPLAGVIVSLSGYVNPERGKMREICLALGAEYVPDFDVKVTHLVCAFMGKTPKIESAIKARATIVMGEWIKDCKEASKRLPVGEHSTSGGGLDEG